ncbi:hypothetical protein D917_02810 [Trichinella nativa]|uniref:Uncharacterized protein n=1 Tax=Trichinella nativa TaxID=6335 RepID=A0A1Y3EBS3_9BILA|nr:hypothetical protein D917_02810 [Trichinella nativa]
MRACESAAKRDHPRPCCLAREKKADPITRSISVFYSCQIFAFHTSADLVTRNLCHYNDPSPRRTSADNCKMKKDSRNLSFRCGAQIQDSWTKASASALGEKVDPSGCPTLTFLVSVDCNDVIELNTPESLRFPCKSYFLSSMMSPYPTTSVPYDLQLYV